ncbi:MAG: PqqD family protein [candidate division WOR-3 bacterium]
MKVFLKENLVFQDLDDKIAIWDPERMETLVLNSTAWYILSLIDEGFNDFEDLVKRVSEDYGIPEDDARKDVWEFIEELKEVGVIWVKE